MHLSIKDCLYCCTNMIQLGVDLQGVVEPKIARKGGHLKYRFWTSQTTCRFELKHVCTIKSFDRLRMVHMVTSRR